MMQAIKRLLCRAGERGNVTVGFVMFMPVAFILMGFGIDASVHGYYVNHQKDILSTAVRNATAFIDDQGRIDGECAAGAALTSYSMNRGQLAADSPVLPEVKDSSRDTFASEGYVNVNGARTQAFSCERGNLSARFGLGSVAPGDKENFIVSEFTVRQPGVAGGKIVPGAVKMCTRENHRSYMFGAFIPKFRNWQTNVCAVSMNILAK